MADRRYFGRRSYRGRHWANHEASPSPGLYPDQKHPDPQHVLPHRHRGPLGGRFRQAPQLGLSPVTPGAAEFEDSREFSVVLVELDWHLFLRASKSASAPAGTPTLAWIEDPMHIAKSSGLVFLLALLSTAALSNPQQRPRSKPGGSPTYLDVVVTRKSGPPVSGLEQQDFTLIDNKLPQTITSFRALGGTAGRVEVLVVVDAVNVDYEKVAYVRQEIEKFLRADGGHLPQPTALALFTDQGTQIQESLTTDGNALSAALDKYTVGLRTIRRTSQYADADRFNLSMRPLRELDSREAQRPGRRIIVWRS